MEDRVIVAGDIYRHFKGRLYQIVSVAIHSETREQMVVYQALYGDYSVYVRPLDMFISEVDHVKYPEVQQLYRFERIEKSSLAVPPQRLTASALQEEPQQNNRTIEQTYDLSSEVNPFLLRFLDAESSRDKLKVLDELEQAADEKLLNSIEASLDIVGVSGSIEQRLDYIITHLRTRARYESDRLR